MPRHEARVPGFNQEREGMKRTCGCCRRKIDIEEFHRDRSRPGGRSTTCALCANEHSGKSVRARNARLLGLPGLFNSLKFTVKVEICPKWLRNPELFFSWALAHGFKRGWRVARKDGNLPYSPRNCVCMRAIDFHRSRPGVKLNQEKVRIIRLLLMRAFPQKDLAAFCGVAPQTISNLNARRTWGDVA